ncbi:MAG: DMT family transporter [Candidatus Levyibacteriota bacterium]
MDWFSLILISVFAVSIYNILQRVLMRDDKSDPVLYTILFAFFLSIAYSVVSLFLGFKLPVLSWTLVLFVLSALLWGFGTIFLFKALKVIEASEVTILTSVRVIITILISVFFLREIFGFEKVLGAILILGSVMLVANIKKGFKFNSGTSYALIVALFYGVAVSLDAIILKTYDVVSYLPIANLLIFVLLLFCYPKAVKKWQVATDRSFLKKMLPLVFFSCTQAYAYYFAIQKAQVSQVSTIGQTQVVVTVILAAILLREKDNLLKKLIASVLVFIGVLLVH